MKEYNQYQRIKNRIEMLVEKLRLNIMLKKTVTTYISGLDYEVTDI